ncbi:MAG: hypothetical protein HZB83_04640, partial [Deltaproteobacteria bacterium]|nr:hypothetical protein [Deltaproteobacteria bacterium]
ASYVNFYLSTDAVITDSDIYIGRRLVSALAGGALSSAANTFTVPVTVAPGTYYIGAIADATGTNPESNEGNNTRASSAVTVTRGIDLIVSALSGPASAKTSMGISVSNTIMNQGTGASVASYVNFYLSTDAAITASDIYLGQRYVGGLAGGASSSATNTFTVPVTVAPGTYYIGAIADATGTNPEYNEGNNTRSSSAVTVTRGIDLIVSEISAPASVKTGTGISASNTVKNQGTGTSAASYVKFYLSTDAVITASDIYLGQRYVGGLAGGASSAAANTFTVPETVAPGTYYIGAIADATNTNLESDEGNNTASSAVIVTP